MGRPSPLPPRSARVVKKRSHIRSRVAGGIAGPWLVTLMTTSLAEDSRRTSTAVFADACACALSSKLRTAATSAGRRPHPAGRARPARRAVGDQRGLVFVTSWTPFEVGPGCPGDRALAFHGGGRSREKSWRNRDASGRTALSSRSGRQYRASWGRFGRYAASDTAHRDGAPGRSVSGGERLRTEAARPARHGRRDGWRRRRRRIRRERRRRRQREPRNQWKRGHERGRGNEWERWNERERGRERGRGNERERRNERERWNGRQRRNERERGNQR